MYLRSTYSCALKMEANYSSEVLVPMYQTTFFSRPARWKSYVSVKTSKLILGLVLASDFPICPEGGGTIFLRNVSTHVSNCTVSPPRILEERYFNIIFCDAVVPTFLHSLLVLEHQKLRHCRLRIGFSNPESGYPIR